MEPNIRYSIKRELGEYLIKNSIEDIETSDLEKASKEIIKLKGDLREALKSKTSNALLLKFIDGFLARILWYSLDAFVRKIQEELKFREKATSSALEVKEQLQRLFLAGGSKDKQAFQETEVFFTRVIEKKKLLNPFVKYLGNGVFHFDWVGENNVVVIFDHGAQEAAVCAMSGQCETYLVGTQEKELGKFLARFCKKKFLIF